MDTRVFQIALLELFWNMTLNDCAFQLSAELDGHSIPLVLCMLKSANLFGSVVSRVINSGKPSGDRVSFRSPSPSPNTFRSVGSSSENTHRRQTFPANFPTTSFSDTDHTRRSAWRRSPTFVKAPEPKDHPRAGHAQFSVRRLHLTHRRVRTFPATRLLLQPRLTPTSLPSSLVLPSEPCTYLFWGFFFASADPPNSFSGELQLLFLHPNPCTCLRKCSSTFLVVPRRDLKPSPFPVVPRCDLQPDNYLSWSASVELWFMGQGYEDHLITQEADIPEAKGLYTNDIQRLYKVASAIVHISQQDLDLSTYIGQIASLKEEFLTMMPLTPDVGAQQIQLDKFFMVLTLIGLRPDLEPVRDQILGSSSVPSLDDVFACLLRISSTQTLPFDSTSDSSVLVSQTSSRGGRSGTRGRGQHPHCTYCNKLGHTRDHCY
ncbi:hypothetical protein CK203_111333 [Vitis vinifera]|uniref:Retrovirus-related Pol polyprotein from transposon RE2 n=1 Tax=Vitis vinifera TaxID=29760 RepID=A0A438CRS6_VITVI|nr:hypothetical protein CK203_111333 [Vitis vinifera]